MTDYYDDPQMLKVYREAAHAAYKIIGAQIIQDCADLLTEAAPGSPIEAIFYAWWIAIRRAHRAVEDDWYGLDLIGQHEITVAGHRYRLDYVVGIEDADVAWDAICAGLEWPKIAVELDGHDFHERTKEQVAYRNQRDRDLQAADWKVFHFSGSELVRNPEQCVREVMEYASRALYRIETHEAVMERRRVRIAAHVAADRAVGLPRA